jgi:UDP-N-acetylmuramate dehydrogenase
MVDIKNLLPNIREGVPLAEYTTFRIGGPAKYFFSAKSKEELAEAAKAANEIGLPFFILAGGSNILISDQGFSGLVIKAENCRTEISFRNFGSSEIYAEAGAMLSDVVELAKENSLTGLEWAAGIYGTIGGAIRGCAGAFDGDISKAVKEIEALDLLSGKIKIFANKECLFEYRSSVFKKNKNLIILSAVFQLEKGVQEKIDAKMNEHGEYKKNHHPLNFPSAGSVFESVNLKDFDKTVLEKYPEIKNFSEKVPAGFLIEKSGLKGKIIGNAQISEKHANFIVNLGTARAEDVFSLIDLAKEKVKENFKIKLEEEIIFLSSPRVPMSSLRTT